MKSINLYRTLSALVISGSIFLVSCKKDDSKTVPEVSGNYPTKIELVSTYNGVSSKVILYEFDYNDKKELKTIKYYNADSIYNALTYNANGRLTKMGTAKNANAIRIEYNSTGDVSKVTESFRGAVGLTENYRTFEYTNSQITKTNFYYGSNTLLRSQVYSTNADGNINTAQYVQGTSSNTATVTYDTKANPLYNLQKNPALAFLPEGLWTNIEFILFSKKLVKEFAYTGDGTKVYSYDLDNQGRIIKISIAGKTNNVVYQTYTLSYLN